MTKHTNIMYTKIMLSAYMTIVKCRGAHPVLVKYCDRIMKMQSCESQGVGEKVNG